ncbi:MAG: hypothetical protein ABWY06_01200 [Pseudomonas sp.]|uniref:hypothetical protein n=1 Tax=Pseudomonas sp. TaxID=306 RepID=UPI003396049C
MQPETVERLNGLIKELNALEIASRTQYHEYLVREQGEKGSLQQHLDAYASLSKFGKPVPEQTINAFGPALPFPADLVAFYRTHGWLGGGKALQYLSVYSLERLVKNKESKSYVRFHSLGLADMINYQWSNAREELDPNHENAIYTQDEIDHLNSNYIVVATWDDFSWASEAHYYIYYDKQGRFGILHVHQDTWYINHMFGESPARQTWDQVMNEALDKILASNKELEE